MQRKWLVRIFCFCGKRFSDIIAALSIGGISNWSSANVLLDKHEKSGCYLQASVSWFEAEQRLTNCCSLDSIHQFYHLPLHQTFIVFCPFAREKGRKPMLQIPGRLHKLEGHFKLLRSLTRQCNIVNVMQRTHSCLSL